LHHHTASHSTLECSNQNSLTLELHSPSHTLDPSPYPFFHPHSTPHRTIPNPRQRRLRQRTAFQFQSTALAAGATRVEKHILNSCIVPRRPIGPSPFPSPPYPVCHLVVQTHLSSWGITLIAHSHAPSSTRGVPSSRSFAGLIYCHGFVQHVRPPSIRSPSCS